MSAIAASVMMIHVEAPVAAAPIEPVAPISGEVWEESIVASFRARAAGVALS
ncbi:hypothetical protein [Streptomyces sp. SudanB66_2053]|uniref:hypothetical protein n=1 Tax=Streptomyces TaxID=1883 RepID=UPI00346F58F3|nr:hypothetical protein [Streptomyces pseudogriseolus]